jgi:hypothetical protein
MSTTLGGVSVRYPNRSARPHPFRGERISHGRGIHRWGMSMWLRPKRRAPRNSHRLTPPGELDLGCDRFTRARSRRVRNVLGVARSIGPARFQADDAAAEHIGVDGVCARPEQAERGATACKRNHRERAIAADHEHGSNGRSGEHECNDPRAKPQRERERERGRNDCGGVWRELWKWNARDQEECNPRASQSQQHQRNSGGAIRITRQRLHHHHDSGCLRRR